MSGTGKRLLLLAGSREARQIATALSRDSAANAVISLARPERVPRPFGIPARIGGFGGEEGFRAFLTHEGIGAILDATHPFAARISERAARVAAEVGVDYLQVLRPAWRPEPGDNWVFLNAEEEAADHIPPEARVFVATGRGSLAGLSGLDTQTLFVRSIGPSPMKAVPANVTFVPGIGPFLIEQEIALFERLRIDWLVVHNTGGSSRAKLDAARWLELPVAMIRRPPQPEAPRVETVSAALSWVRRRQ